LVDKSFFFVDKDGSNDRESNNEDGYEEFFETEIPNHIVYVLIENNIDLTNAIFLNEIEDE
jgi:hypothetical protein